MHHGRIAARRVDTRIGHTYKMAATPENSSFFTSSKSIAQPLLGPPVFQKVSRLFYFPWPFAASFCSFFCLFFTLFFGLFLDPLFERVFTGRSGPREMPLLPGGRRDRRQDLFPHPAKPAQKVTRKPAKTPPTKTKCFRFLNLKRTLHCKLGLKGG